MCPDLSTVSATRLVTTRSKRWTIRFPLAQPQGMITPAAGQRRAITVQREMNRLLNDGFTVICPLTGRLVKIYRRSLHRSQVRVLERLREKSVKLRVNYLHLEFFTSRRDGDLAKLEAWQLVQRLRPISALEGEKVRGQWRITERGCAWLDGLIKIPRQVAILQGEVLGYVDENDLITTAEVLEAFTRAELDPDAPTDPRAA